MDVGRIHVPHSCAAKQRSLLAIAFVVIAALILTGCAPSRPPPRPPPLPTAEPEPPTTAPPRPPIIAPPHGGIVRPRPPPDAVPRDGPPKKQYVTVEVFYGTDRARGATDRPSTFYGTQRGRLEYGVTSVSIPRLHQRGELESPVWWKLEFSENPARHVVLLSVEPMTSAQFHSAVAGRTAPSGQRDVLVFVHGFNVTFEDSVRRTAQLSYDLPLRGVPVTYSWPSQGSTSPVSYTTDEANVEWTEPHLKRFLVDLKASVHADARIHLIAHSMGNRALTKALRAIAAETSAPLFSQVILTAPDIDREVFERDIAPAVIRMARRTTLYASSDDEALKVSAGVHGNTRAGQSQQPLVFVSGLDTVDASGIDTSFLGHTHMALPLVMDDLAKLIRQDLGPRERNLRAWPAPPDPQRYWSFPR